MKSTHQEEENNGDEMISWIFNVSMHTSPMSRIPNFHFSKRLFFRFVSLNSGVVSS